MTEHVTIRRLATGVPGLDAILGGGLPEFSFNLVTGPPGAGKTTLAHQLMFALATPEQPALFFTALGEPPWKMLRYQQQFGFFAQDKIGVCIRFVHLSEELIAGDFDQVLARIAEEVRDFGPAVHPAAGHHPGGLADHQLSDRRIFAAERSASGVYRC